MGAERKHKAIQETAADRAAREQRKRDRLDHQAELARSSELRSAGIEYDPRTGAGRREFQVDSLGGTKRARSLRYDRLFRNKADASQERCLACQMFDDLWHAALAGDFPVPKFEPQVDTSYVGRTPIEGIAQSKEELATLKRTLGRDAVAILFARVIENRSFKSLAESEKGDERRLSAVFIAAADAAARFFRLVPESPLVARMRQAEAA